jgi:hypothetical protein
MATPHLSDGEWSRRNRGTGPPPRGSDASNDCYLSCAIWQTAALNLPIAVPSARFQSLRACEVEPEWPRDRCRRPVRSSSTAPRTDARASSAARGRNALAEPGFDGRPLSKGCPDNQRAPSEHPWRGRGRSRGNDPEIPDRSARGRASIWDHLNHPPSAQNLE